MQFNEVMERSAYGTIGYIADPGDLQVLERHIVHNLPLLRAFTQMIVATNYGGGSPHELVSGNREVWRRYFPDCAMLDSRQNRGHSIGTSDLGNLLFDHCKAHDIQWLCKGANDVLLSAPVLDIEIEAADFYYLNAISYSVLRQQDFDLARIGEQLFYPQTNFYAIDVSKTDFLIDKVFLDRSWAIVNRIPDYNGKIWEHIPRWSCELLLRKCVLRNGLTRCHLMDDAQFRHLLGLVQERAIEDCSHKNLTINGICHIHEAAQ